MTVDASIYGYNYTIYILTSGIIALRHDSLHAPDGLGVLSDSRFLLAMWKSLALHASTLG